MPPGYQWQDQVEWHEENTLERSTASKSGADTPQVVIGKTLVFRMEKPSDWDSFEERRKWQRKRDHLCKYYGELCFSFLEDPESLRNQLGRITVAPNDYYALFEVWSSPGVEKQYNATMVLLEEGLGMDRDHFLSLKSMLGMCWQQPTKSSNKRPLDEDTSQLPMPKDDAPARNAAKRVRFQGPAPDPEQDPKPKPILPTSRPSLTGSLPSSEISDPAPVTSRLAPPSVPNLPPVVSKAKSEVPRLPEPISETPLTWSMSTPAVSKPTTAVSTQRQILDLPASEVRYIRKALFPAAAWEPVAAAAKNSDENATCCTCPRTEPHSCGRFTTISGTLYARRLQALETTQQAHYDPHPRLCVHAGRGKKDADKAESKHRAGVFTDFYHTIQSCTDVATSCNYDLDEVIQQLAVRLGVAKDPLLASAEFGGAADVLKWAIVFWIFVETSMAHYIGELGEAKWAGHHLSARTEMYQALQERAWQCFRGLVVRLRRVLQEGVAA
ncbi:hypothetical protein G647_10212 [Cladophialophora carrionii CBS 160.54]|uniref:Uncharacterized protein n=1 Tax=Cladophialophora carrionii CBS 160.54 TaxID=1279043 RepID=V9DLE8_9EURO|nr:uncharacterized protein G647_10212 [Cladophialophora carrionii CBS 160.54]ETI26767.1 hypothetical protein G647_10212 [Cladophialophora carrionii CBS 160.54]